MIADVTVLEIRRVLLIIVVGKLTHLDIGPGDDILQENRMGFTVERMQCIGGWAVHGTSISKENKGRDAF
jgi:hypothetical protein